MKSSTKKRIAVFGIAAAAVVAIQGTVSGAGAGETTCRTWQPQGIVVGEYQHTLHPQNPVAEQYQHTWNQHNDVGGQLQHSWNPDNADAGQHQQILNPPNPVAEQYQHAWNPAGEATDPCPLPAAAP